MARDTGVSTALPASSQPVPGSVLIVGAGVFGLSTFSTLLTLPRYAQTRIILIDTHLPSLESPTNVPIQNPCAASIDSSRIVRPDYANPSYARLAIAAQEKWRKGYGNCLSCGQHESIYGGIKGTGEIVKCKDKTCEHEPVYREPGLVITGSGSGTEYFRKAKKNAEELGLNVRTLDGCDEITAALEGYGGRSHSDTEQCANSKRDESLSDKDDRLKRERSQDRASAVGEIGYINYSSGWVDNGRAMANIMAQSITLAQNRNCQPDKGKTEFVCGKAAQLLFSRQSHESSKVTGVKLANGHEVQADLTILATGAHTPSLLDLRGHAEARGQVVAYTALTPSEAESLRDTPVLLNMTTGMFVIPPVLVSLPLPSSPNSDPSATTSSSTTTTWLLKVAQHAYGYANPTTLKINTPGNITREIIASIPAPRYSPIPNAAEECLRTFLHSLPLHPSTPAPAQAQAISRRPFLTTRLCWYTDTPSGDFLITPHPTYSSLFLATGGSGHGFKFMPVLGEKIIEGIEGRLEAGLGELWGWRLEGGGEFEGTEDGSRGGIKGEILGGEWSVDGGVNGGGVRERAKL